MSKKVAITGIGVVSSIGIGKDAFWNNLIQGKSGISEIDLFDTSKFNRHYGGEIKGFNPAKFIPKDMAKFFGRASCFAIAATKLALEDANISLADYKNKRIGVIIGTTMTEANVLDFSVEKLLKDEWKEITNTLLLNSFSPSIPRNIGTFFQLKTPVNLLIPNACAAGNYAVGYALDLIKNGELDLAIAGGAEALSRVAFQGFQRLYAMALKDCTPFDKDRKGMLLGEGAGILILEPQDSVLKRKAAFYAEVSGYGLSCDAYHMTAPKRDGIKKAMQKAVNNSGISMTDIDYINAHGTGTLQNDKEEAGAINELFGAKRVAVSSTKSMLGHCMGAASAIEGVVCCLALKNGIIPPTINFTTPDPQCDIDCVPNQARKAKLNHILNNSFAFGGNNCCVVFSRN
ncbi:MAG: beta-ketoacyl-[acyl-carrier-protein] synthase family protein [Candidatus Omnitrophica bacterium]|nr:beta-ketoacyl-[acyl-carrier-protein] synthase family protein [Candidatus Omnitrophota bacterium]MDD5237576.1 beta-ketoacyl-[acyl-carrier-protein] synthase family protein [Candidatus Omnitrophota bacterium]